MRKSLLAAAAVAPFTFVLIANVSSCGPTYSHPPPPEPCEGLHCGATTTPPIVGADTNTGVDSTTDTTVDGDGVTQDDGVPGETVPLDSGDADSFPTADSVGETTG